MSAQVGNEKTPTLVQARLEPHYCISGTREYRAAQVLLFQVGVEEKNWPVMELARLLTRKSRLVAVYLKEECVGAAIIVYRHPFPCEKPPFAFGVPKDGRVACEVALIAVSKKHRRRSGDGGAAVLDALVKGLYRVHLASGGTHIYSLCEEWTFRILTDGYVGIVGRTIGDGVHYWCGTDDCPSNKCQVTYVCELDMRASETHWRQDRPEFWAYLSQA